MQRICRNAAAKRIRIVVPAAGDNGAENLGVWSQIKPLLPSGATLIHVRDYPVNPQDPVFQSVYQVYEVALRTDQQTLVQRPEAQFGRSNAETRR